MRVERDMTLDEIAERLALPKTTVYYWIKDIPLQRQRNWGRRSSQRRPRIRRSGKSGGMNTTRGAWPNGQI